jgi:hypothetical protein
MDPERPVTETEERPELTEEQLKQLEAELAKIKVDDVLLQTVVSLLNIGVRKAGLVSDQPAGGEPAQKPQPDYEQLRQAIEAIRALLPLLDERHHEKLGPVRDSLSKLQIIYAQGTGTPQGSAGGPASSEEGQTQAGEETGKPATPGDPTAESSDDAGPAERSGRLWVPGNK